MKQLSLGIVIGALAGASLTYMLVTDESDGDSAAPGAQSVTNQTPVRRPGGGFVPPVTATDSRADAEFRELAESNPRAAMDTFQSAADIYQRGNVMEAAMRDWSNADFESAMDRISQISNPELSALQYGMVYTAWSQQDTAAALRYLTRLGSNSDVLSPRSGIF